MNDFLMPKYKEVEDKKKENIDHKSLKGQWCMKKSQWYENINKISIGGYTIFMCAKWL